MCFFPGFKNVLEEHRIAESSVLTCCPWCNVRSFSLNKSQGEEDYELLRKRSVFFLTGRKRSVGDTLQIIPKENLG